MPLLRLLYRSDSRLTGSEQSVREAIFEIAERAALRNASDGVSGGLMFADGVFVQILEGEVAAIEVVFERICRDMRHSHVVLLDYSVVDRRLFGDRGMIAFEGDHVARSLFPTASETTSFAHRNPLSANAVVDLMRALLDERVASV